jgi:hypothetical protein
MNIMYVLRARRVLSYMMYDVLYESNIVLASMCAYSMHIFFN